jgi:hypothetical protein
MTRCRPVVHGRGAIAAVLLSFGLVACVNDVPPPTAQLGASSQAILAAERAGAMQYAPVELQAARAKMAAADAAMRADDRIAARRLAEEAQVDANVAAAKAQTVAAQQAATPPSAVYPPGAAGSSTTVTTISPAAPPAYGGPTSWSPQGIQSGASSTTTTTTIGPAPLWAPDTTTSVGAGKSASVGVPR